MSSKEFDARSLAVEMEDSIDRLVHESIRLTRSVIGLEQERDEARAEVAHLRRGIDAYRMEKDCSHRSDHCFPTCASCAWELLERTQRSEKV